MPGHKDLTPVPLKPLGEFAVLGPDARDIHDGFEVSQQVTAFQAFWSHDAQVITAIDQNPNAFLAPLPEAKPGRHLRLANDLWPLAGKIVLAERIRLSTQRLVCLRLSQAVLSNTWWPVALRDQFQNIDIEKTLALWLNSTLGIFLLVANRQETEGAWMKFKKPVLSSLPVLNLGSLSDKQLSQLSAAYDKVCQEELRPFPEMDKDPVRARIDAAVSQALGLPDFSILRSLLAQEPVVCLKRL